MTEYVDLEERIEKCRNILAEHPDSQIFAALAEAYRKNKELDKAFEICRNGLKNHQDYGAAHLIMAKINFDRDMYVEAEKELLLAIKLDGRTRVTEQLLARIMIKKGEYKDAKSILDKLISTDKKNTTLKMLLEETQKSLKEQKKKGIILKPVNYMAEEEEKPQKAKKTLTCSEAQFALTTLPNLMAALIIGDDGLIIESRLKIDLDQENISAVTIELFRVIKAGLPKIDYGNLQKFLLETEDFCYWMIKLKRGVLLLVCRSEANLGYLKIRVEEILSQIAE
ncbi:MAG: hypothetical protein OEV55_05995 [candidate division Zixibacteria bacterium]|nr:hypothetical protein [candidate division Zixibacteria bacterium]